MRGVIVRALWGGATTSVHALNCAAAASQYSKLLTNVEQRVVGFGDEAGANLRRIGYSPILARDFPPRDYPRRPRKLRRLPTTDPHGRWVNGLSMWWRKLQAIRLAWDQEPRPDAIIWLDWDTVVNRFVPPEAFITLARGPSLRGRVRQYFRPQVGWRKTHRRQVFHGGCFFCRDRNLIDRIIALHAGEFHACTDEVPITRAVDALADEAVGPSDDTLRLRELRFDCPWLYSTRHNVIPSSESSLFSEGAFTALRHHIRLSAVYRPVSFPTG